MWRTAFVFRLVRDLGRGVASSAAFRFEPAVDSAVYSHSTIPGSVIEAFTLGKFLTKRDEQATKLTEKYLVNDGTR
jgi:hypothetical protein